MSTISDIVFLSVAVFLCKFGSPQVAKRLKTLVLRKLGKEKKISQLAGDTG